MATANDIITRAGKRAGVLPDEAEFTASEAVDALQALNDLMHGFGPMGIYYAHRTLEATDTVNMPDEQLRNLVLMLVKELALDFGTTVGPELVAEIERARDQLQAAYFMQRPGLVDSALIPRRFGWR